MKVISMEVDGLHGSNDTLKIAFNGDLNIITGRNGAGKTTALKLLWYIISGNIRLALNEIQFDKVEIRTSDYKCVVKRKSSNECEVSLIDSQGKMYDFKKDGQNFLDENNIWDTEDNNWNLIVRKNEAAPNSLLRKTGSSLFFPTFRRIEGGFSIESSDIFSKRTLVTDTLEEVLSDLSKKLTNHNHQFVASVSTKDIELLLVRKFSEISEEVNNIQKLVSNNALSKIKDARNNADKKFDAQSILDTVQEEIEELEKIRKEKMQPFETLKEMVLNFLNHSSVKLGSSVNRSFTIGNTADTINSDLLSAGEKQMLSFIAYNTFYRDTVFIIDEPELSLHVDWQRQLLPTLMKQGTSNQFIVATHSPFIYSKYPDKETPLIEDRGFDTVEINDMLGRE